MSIPRATINPSSNGRYPPLGHFIASPLLRSWLRSSRGTSVTSAMGLTLLEALVAMIIISVIISVLTPPIFLTVATRVYQRKTEQALNIAQQEIDEVRRTINSRDYISADMAKVLPPTVPNKTKLNTSPAPTSVCNKPPTALAYGQLYCTTATAALERGENSGGVGGSTDNGSVFYVQVFRSEGTPLLTGGTTRGSFRMAVRVYEEEPTAGKTLRTDQAALTFTTGTANRKGKAAQPLAVLYTEVSRSDSGKESLESIQNSVRNDRP
jgi:type II secretory pathway pseudopilin PulG